MKNVNVCVVPVGITQLFAKLASKFTCAPGKHWFACTGTPPMDVGGSTHWPDAYGAGCPSVGYESGTVPDALPGGFTTKQGSSTPGVAGLSCATAVTFMRMELARSL